MNSITRTISFRSPRSLAFSLVELVLVLSIVAVVSAIAIPRYANSISRYRLDAAAKRIVQDLAVASVQASSSSRSQRVIFDTVSQSYTIPKLENLNAAAGAYAVALAGDPYRVQLVSADFNGSATLNFDIYGNPDNAGTIVIRLGGDTRTIRINSAGLVTVS